MRKLVLALAAGVLLSTMTAGLASAGREKPTPTADLSVCSRTENGQYVFTVAWADVKNPYQIELYGGPTTDITAAVHRATTQLNRHASPFSFIGLQVNFNYTYVFAVVENRKGAGPSDYVLMSSVPECVPS